jgi:hypothetical protein
MSCLIGVRVGRGASVLASRQHRLVHRGGRNEGKEEALQTFAASTGGFQNLSVDFFTLRRGGGSARFSLRGADKARQFAEDSFNAVVRNAVCTEVTAAAKNAQGGAGIAKTQAAAAAGR